MEALLNIDNNLFTLINNHMGNGFFDLILVPLRHKLFWIPLYLFLVTFIMVNFRKQAWVVFVGIAMTIILSDTMSSKVIKKNVQRIRPCHVEKLDPIQRVPCSHGYSFTSSHATNHFAIGTFLFFLFSFTKYRILLMLWAGVISFAQVYVGVHYPIDVICGSLLGMMIGWISFKTYQIIKNAFYKPENIIV